MLRLFEQYELSDNARTMFKALEEFKTARLDEAALGRLIRLSPTNRAALLNTMVKWYDFYSHLFLPPYFFAPLTASVVRRL